MSISNVQLLTSPVVLTTSAATLYTAPAAPTNVIVRNGELIFSNTTGGAVTITLYVIPSGGSAGDSNTVTKTFSIASAQLPTVIALPDLAAGTFIQALASANTSITVFSSGGVVLS